MEKMNMKNRTKMMKALVTAVITVTLAASLTGCGTETKATNQDASDETMMEEEIIVAGDNDVEETVDTADVTEEDSIPSITYGNLVVYNDAIDTDYKFDFDSFQTMEGEYTINADIDIYYTGGAMAGYIKSGTTVQAYDRNEEWMRFYNPERNDVVTVEFLLVKVEELKNAVSGDDLLAFEDTDNNVQTEDTSTSENTNLSEEEQKIQEALSLIDENKTYTPEEVQELYPSILEVMGITWNPEFSGKYTEIRGGEERLHLEGAKLKEDTEQIIYLCLYGVSGTENYDECYFDIQEEDSAENAIIVYLWRN